MKRPFLLAAIALWCVMLLPSQARRMGRLAEASPRAFLTRSERSAFESEYREFHAFLKELAANVPARGSALLLVNDPAAQFIYYQYRGLYELYPTRLWAFPFSSSLPAQGIFTVGVDEKMRGLIEAEAIRLAGIYYSRNPKGSRLYRVRDLSRNGMELETLTGPGKEDPRRVPDRGNLARWAAGVGSLMLVGWLFNGATGLSASFGSDLAARAAMALFSGAGFAALSLLFASLAGLRWTWPVVGFAVFLPAAAAALVWRRRREPPPPPATEKPVQHWEDKLGILLVGLAGLSALFHAWLPKGAWRSWDAWAIYDLKTKVLWESLGLPLAFLSDPLYEFTNQVYPPGFQIVQGYLSLWAGGVGSPQLRLISPLYHLAQTAIFAHLVRDLGVRRGSWLLAGLLALVPALLDQAVDGYMDLLVGALMTAALALLVKVARGKARPWTVAWFCGIAAFTKPEGISFGVFAMAALAWLAFRRMISWRAWSGSLGVMALTAEPWRILTRFLGVGLKDWDFSVSHALSGLFGKLFFILKAFLLETLGPGAAAISSKAGVFEEPVRWWMHTEQSWLLLWPIVVAGLIIGRRQLADPALKAVLLVLGMQFLAHVLLYLTTVHDLSFHLISSVYRRLIQFAPGALAIAGAAWWREAFPERGEGEPAGNVPYPGKS